MFALIVNDSVLLVPLAVATAIPRDPVAPLRTRFAVMDVELDTLTPVTMTPVPLTATVVPPATKSAPVKVTGKVAPCTANDGLTNVSAGVPGGGFASVHAVRHRDQTPIRMNDFFRMMDCLA